MSRKGKSIAISTLGIVERVAAEGMAKLLELLPSRDGMSQR